MEDGPEDVTGACLKRRHVANRASMSMDMGGQSEACRWQAVPLLILSSGPGGRPVAVTLAPHGRMAATESHQGVHIVDTRHALLVLRTLTNGAAQGGALEEPDQYGRCRNRSMSWLRKGRSPSAGGAALGEQDESAVSGVSGSTGSKLGVYHRCAGDRQEIGFGSGHGMSRRRAHASAARSRPGASRG